MKRILTIFLCCVLVCVCCVVKNTTDMQVSAVETTKQIVDLNGATIRILSSRALPDYETKLFITFEE